MYGFLAYYLSRDILVIRYIQVNETPTGHPHYGVQDAQWNWMPIDVFAREN